MAITKVPKLRISDKQLRHLLGRGSEGLRMAENTGQEFVKTAHGMLVKNAGRDMASLQNLPRASELRRAVAVTWNKLDQYGNPLERSSPRQKMLATYGQLLRNRRRENVVQSKLLKSQTEFIGDVADMVNRNKPLAINLPVNGFDGHSALGSAYIPTYNPGELRYRGVVAGRIRIRRTGVTFKKALPKL